MDQPFDFSSFGEDGQASTSAATASGYSSHDAGTEQTGYFHQESDARESDWQLQTLSSSSHLQDYNNSLYTQADQEQLPDYYRTLLVDGGPNNDAGAIPAEQPVEGNEEDGESLLQLKPMAEFASQRFKRKPRKKKQDDGTGGKKNRKRKAEEGGTEGENQPGFEEEAAVGDALMDGNEMEEAAEGPPTAEEEELDESEQAAADDFYSQLLEWPAAATLNDDAVLAQSESTKLTSRNPKRTRWHPEEIAFFQRCVALFNCNFNMMQDLLPHRTLAELKKQYDKQRVIYPSLYASFASSPRFETVDEYYELLDELEKEKEELETTMIELGVKPWSLFNRQPTSTRESEPEEVPSAATSVAEMLDDEEEDSNLLYSLG